MERPMKIRDTEIGVTDVLKLISQGYGYDQILSRHRELTMGDIMVTAEFARQVLEQFVTNSDTIQIDHKVTLMARSGSITTLEAERKTHPRAFQPWSRKEEEQLRGLFESGESVKRMAEIHQRREGAIRRRLERLGLMEPPGAGDNGSRPQSTDA